MRSRSRWLRGVLILNGALVAIPAILAFFAYLYIKIELAIEAARNNGDPVIYQHFFWVEGPIWPIIVYFLIPNGILAGTFAAWYYSTYRQSSTP